jgi:hypothetical protein
MLKKIYWIRKSLTVLCDRRLDRSLNPGAFFGLLVAPGEIFVSIS